MCTHTTSRHPIVLTFGTLLFWDCCTVQAGTRMHCDVPGLPTTELLHGWSTDGLMLAVERGQGEAQMRCESEARRLREAVLK